MSLKALITTLVLGTSSVALAAPAVAYGPTVRDHRADASHREDIDVNARAGIQFHGPRPLPPTPAPTWVTLANNTQVNGRTAIRVASGQRAYTKLELRAESGKTQIDKVMIVFGNGTSQVVNLKAKLGSKQQTTASIDLTGNARFIERIVLVGSSKGRNASVDVLAI